jgi:hypothetical protein
VASTLRPALANGYRCPLLVGSSRSAALRNWVQASPAFKEQKKICVVMRRYASKGDAKRRISSSAPLIRADTAVSAARFRRLPLFRWQPPSVKGRANLLMSPNISSSAILGAGSVGKQIYPVPGGTSRYEAVRPAVFAAFVPAPHSATLDFATVRKHPWALDSSQSQINLDTHVGANNQKCLHRCAFLSSSFRSTPQLTRSQLPTFPTTDAQHHRTICPPVKLFAKLRELNIFKSCFAKSVRSVAPMFTIPEPS